MQKIEIKILSRVSDRRRVLDCQLGLLLTNSYT
jgi:hypothetical protein